ncbi:MAG: DsbA family protein [Myxococcota bacterium]
MTTFFFDYISPYSFIACRLLERSGQGWTPAPVVLGSILSHRGVQGPGEEDVRRHAGLVDLLLLCAHYDIPVEGPAKHPFNSVPALRTTLAVHETGRARVVARFFEAAWSEGVDLESTATLQALLDELKIEVDAEAATFDRSLRAQLKADTRTFIERGGFGVPTVAEGQLLFFGHDRLELARAYAEGRIELDEAKLAHMGGRPRPPRLT